MATFRTLATNFSEGLRVPHYGKTGRIMAKLMLSFSLLHSRMISCAQHCTNIFCSIMLFAFEMAATRHADAK